MKRTTKKRLGLILALAMVLSLLPMTAMAAPAKYKVWVQGVQVTDGNKDDVLDDGGSVKFTPATEEEAAKLTLTDANITGAQQPGNSQYTAGIYSDIDLTLELVGDSTITGTPAAWSSRGIGGRYLTITGSGALDITTATSGYSVAINVNFLTMESGTVTATAGKAAGKTGTSTAIYSNWGVTIAGGYLTAVGGEAETSHGIVTAPASSIKIEVNGGTVTAIGNNRGFSKEPDLSGYTDPAVTVNTAATAEGATAWNGTDALGGEDSSFKYVHIEPKALTSITITTPPDKTEYMDGESFDPTGMVVTATYNDGSTAEITDYTFEPSGALTSDDTEITITYTENGVTVTVTVSITVRATCTVTFDPNGGTGQMEPVSVMAGDEYVLPKCTFRAPSGMQFAGWDKGDVGDTIVITGDVVLVAQWEKDTFSFTDPTNPVIEPGDQPKPGTHPSDIFVDVDPGEWYVDGIDYVVEHGLMEGVGGNRFDPHGTLTRGMLVTILYRLEGSPGVVGEMPFTDVTSGTWYFNAILWASENNIVNGYGDGRFGPTDSLTRQQLAAILYRYANGKGYDISKGESTDLSTFTDAALIHEYAVTPMRWVCGEELLRTTGRLLEPAAYATRGLVADMLMRFAALKK